MRFLFGLSITLNLLLLTTIVAARVDSTRESIPVRVGSEQVFQLDSSSVPRREIEEIGELVEIIQRTALGVNHIKTLTLGWLVENYRAAYQSAGPSYWQPNYSPRINDIEERVAIEQRVRDALIAFFGQSAASDLAFDSAFRPLGAEYAFLDSQAQLDLQRSQLELLASRDSTREIQTSQMARCLSDGIGMEQAPTSSGLPADFGVSAVREYRLRFSPLAQQLRDSAVTDDEQEFRALFDKLQELEQNPSPQAQAQLRADLRATIGDGNFDRLWSLRDPFFGAIEDFLVAEGFSAHQVQAAYSVVNRSQEALLSTMGQSGNPESMLSAIGRIRRDEAAHLSRLLGDEAVAGLSAATSQATLQLSNTSVVRC